MLKLNAYQLKWIAIVGMFLQHMLIAWSGIIPAVLRFPLYAVGGVTFPIMAFFVVEGYRHTSDLERYILRLFVVGLIAAPFHIMVLGLAMGGGNPLVYPWLNIMFGIILSLFVLLMYDKIKYRAVFWLIYVIIILPVSFLFFEWYFIGVTMVLLFHIIRNEKARRIVPPVFTGAAWLLLMLMFNVDASMDIFMAYADFPALMAAFAVVCSLVSLLLLGYSGQRGRKAKWLFYIFYPGHFVLLALVGLALGFIDLSLLGF
ncbi:MAG: conjugal transfer protein TraX [Defluviitaleaceae bacterium]|nr:conjugal transfer protein TraX [Defluviitaleaceae bacterium]